MTYPLVIRPASYQNKQTNEPEILEESLFDDIYVSTVSGCVAGVHQLKITRLSKHFYIIQSGLTSVTATAADAYVASLPTDIFVKDGVGLIESNQYYTEFLSLAGSTSAVIQVLGGTTPNISITKDGANFGIGDAFQIFGYTLLIKVNDY